MGERKIWSKDDYHKKLLEEINSQLEEFQPSELEDVELVCVYSSNMDHKEEQRNIKKWSKDEFLRELMETLKILEEEKHISELAEAGKDNEVDDIMSVLDYSYCEGYIKHLRGLKAEKLEEIDISEIPEQYIEVFTIYMLCSGCEEWMILRDRKQLQKALFERGKVAKTIAEIMDSFTFEHLSDSFSECMKMVRDLMKLKKEFLTKLLKNLKYLEEECHISKLAAEGKKQEIKDILKNIDYSLLDNYLDNPDKVCLQYSDIPKEYIVAYAIYLLNIFYKDEDMQYCIYIWFLGGNEFDRILSDLVICYGEVGEKLAEKLAENWISE